MTSDDDFDIEALLFGTKRCSHCGRELPASSDFFGRDKYGKKCGSVYPATKEHWPLDARCKNGLGPQCRYCTRAYKRAWRLTAVQRAQQEIEERIAAARR